MRKLASMREIFEDARVHSEPRLSIRAYAYKCNNRLTFQDRKLYDDGLGPSKAAKMVVVVKQADALRANDDGLLNP
jgi:hypothetical protein